MSTSALPDYADVLAAAARIAAHAHVTPVLRSRSLDLDCGAELHFKCENLQRAGAFKVRGACNAVWSLTEAEAARGVVTQSSGNHGAALALAARTRGIAAHVVVPAGAVPAKLAAIRAYGATLHECAPTMAAREAMASRVQADTGARLVHPFTDPLVIAGQGTAALELQSQAPMLDFLLTPVGGGGLVSGSAIAVAGRGAATRVPPPRPATAIALPPTRPPPPTGVSSRSRPPDCASISSAAVPCPAITAGSVTGGTRRAPVSACTGAAIAARAAMVGAHSCSVAP